MKLRRKLIKVGNNSLMVVIPKDICEGLELKEGMELIIDIEISSKKKESKK